MAGQPVELGALPEAQAAAGKPGRGHISFLLHYLLMAMVKLDTTEGTTGEIMVATIKVAREVAG